MRVGILTSVETRHRFFARTIAGRFDVGAAVYARPGYSPAGVAAADLSAAESCAVAEHFAERDLQESQYFGGDAEFLEDSPSCAVRRVGPGELNTPETLRLLAARGVDTVVVFGTDLIKSPLLGFCPGRMINLHLGLSPYYRGTATNFYPLLNGEPEYVGATIHLVDAGIDSGPILRHARPEIVAGDRPHSIGCKAILAGIEALFDVLERLLRKGTIEGVPQWKPANGRLYLRRDYHPRQVVEMVRRFDAGMIEKYLERLRRGECEMALVTGGGSDYPIESADRNPVEV